MNAEQEAAIFRKLAESKAKRRGVSWASVRLARYTLGVQSILAQIGQVWRLPNSGGT